MCANVLLVRKGNLTWLISLIFQGINFAHIEILSLLSVVILASLKELCSSVGDDD